MEKIKQISVELKNWIITTLKSGAKPEAIAEALIKKGFDEKFAYTTLLRITSNQSVQTIENTYDYEPIKINTETSDRKIKILSRIEKPSIIHLENVLSAEECEELILLSKERLQSSTVVNSETGEVKTSSGRTSSGMAFSIRENSLVEKIEKRISEITYLPLENGEGLQVLNYKIGEEYKSHFDYFPVNKIDETKGGQRVGTMLIYLNDVEYGGGDGFSQSGNFNCSKKRFGDLFSLLQQQK